MVLPENHTPSQTPPALSNHREHQALHSTWRNYFANQNNPTPNPALPIVPDNLLPEINVPWGPDAHAHINDDHFRIFFGNQNGIPRVNDSIPSWASTMDFLLSLRVSLFAFTEPNLHWDRTMLHEAKTIQRRFFSQGQLITSESQLNFPSHYKPGGTCVGINGNGPRASSTQELTPLAKADGPTSPSAAEMHQT